MNVVDIEDKLRMIAVDLQADAISTELRTTLTQEKYRLEGKLKKIYASRKDTEK